MIICFSNAQALDFSRTKFKIDDAGTLYIILFVFLLGSAASIHSDLLHNYSHG